MSDRKKYNFADKVALVTGSSAGIGAAIAIQFAEFGARLTITGRNRENLDRVAAKISELTEHRPLVIVGDLLDESFVEELLTKTVEHYGRLDILVNNAGSHFVNDSIDNENLIEEFDKMFMLNVRQPLRLIQMASKWLEKTGGNIINISSNASHEPVSYFLFS